MLEKKAKLLNRPELYLSIEIKFNVSKLSLIRGEILKPRYKECIARSVTLDRGRRCFKRRNNINRSNFHI